MATIPLQTVESTNIAAVGYEAGHLVIQFKGGGTYVYKDVPAGLHKELMSAQSKGGFLNREIKGKFQSEKVS